MAYPERKSHTVTVTTAGPVGFVCPTDPDVLTAVKNIGANAVWVQHLSDTGAVASLEGANCEPILAGETVYVSWQKTPYSFLAATADTKIVMTNAMGRM